KLEALSGGASEVQRTLLLVDDDAVMIRTLREGLSVSYKVLPANSGANALKILARAKPDLILLDYEMPEMNGPQVLEALRENPDTANIPVMFLTAKNDAKSIAKIESLKPQGHLLKTLPLREIKEILQKFFDGK
ncbi:MAG: response regulator, partial [Synergistaceae bacterium]|nr:response regulator [Synergistaceae bacterium]